MNNIEGIEEKINVNAIKGFKNKAALITAENHWARKLGWFNDGGDTFGATFWRCYFGYFFMFHLPNRFGDDGEHGESHVGDQYTGPVAAAMIALVVLGAGYYFMRCEESRWLKRKLSDEFLLAYYALKKKAENDESLKETFDETDALIKRHIELDRSTDLGNWWKWFWYKNWEWQEEGDEYKRIAALKKTVNDNDNDHSCEKIYRNLKEEKTITATHNTEQSRLRNIWDTLFGFCVYYGYAQWLVWFLTTLVLYQSLEGYGINPDDPKHSDQPGFFDDASEQMLVFQVIFPLGVAALATLYNMYSAKRIENPLKNANTDYANEQLGKIRGNYLKSSDQTNPPKQTTHSHFYQAEAATFVTTFIGVFLIGNIVAWPSIGLFQGILGIEMENTDYVPTIFAVTTAVALLQSALKVYDMRAEQRNVFNQKESIEAPRSEGFWSLYRQKEHWHLAVYFVVGRFLGNGGILLLRILFNGEGMGNFRVKDGDAHLEEMDRMLLLGIGLAVTVFFMIPLNLYQHWKAVERDNALNAERDSRYKLLT